MSVVERDVDCIDKPRGGGSAVRLLTKMFKRHCEILCLLFYRGNVGQPWTDCKV